MRWFGIVGVGLLVGSCAALAQANGDFMNAISVEGMNITIGAGTYAVADGKIVIKTPQTLAISPATMQRTENESLMLSPKEPKSFHSGTKLAALNAWDTNAANALDASSLVIRKEKEGPALILGKDYLVSPEFGMVGLAPGSPVKPEETVYATYSYGLQRVDSIVQNKQGILSVVTGTPHISVPRPPEIVPGMKRLLNVYVRACVGKIERPDLFPVMETAASAKTDSKPGRIPQTLAKIRRGKPVTIVCWGDSVTAGGNASKPEMRYVNQFARMLKAKFPKAAIDVQNISVGGSGSPQWLRLPPFEDYGQKPEGRDTDFERVLAAKPDLVTIEFVNDCGLQQEHWENCYKTILKRLRPLGTEVILITPHFTMLPMMGTVDIRTEERRPYVAFLHAFAERENVGLADASSRWAHLWKEGIPYMTELHNTINHPDDRGHTMFAEELMKCFEK